MKKPGQSFPEYVPVGFISRRCGVSNSTVLRWINSGALPAFRLPGGHFRISRDDFYKFLERYGMASKIRRETFDIKPATAAFESSGYQENIYGQRRS